MARLIVAPEVQEDSDRIFDFLAAYAPDHAVSRIDEIVAALDILQTSPQIGRFADSDGMRALVISTGTNSSFHQYSY
jgi:toxin ParE1/3/4